MLDQVENLLTNANGRANSGRGNGFGLRRGFGPAGENIFVNAIAPSILDTEENRRAQPDADYSSWVTLEAAAQAITFLASPQNQAIRSANIPLYATG